LLMWTGFPVTDANTTLGVPSMYGAWFMCSRTMASIAGDTSTVRARRFLVCETICPLLEDLFERARIFNDRHSRRRPSIPLSPPRDGLQASSVAVAPGLGLFACSGGELGCDCPSDVAPSIGDSEQHPLLVESAGMYAQVHGTRPFDLPSTPYRTDCQEAYYAKSAVQVDRAGGGGRRNARDRISTRASDSIGSWLEAVVAHCGEFHSVPFAPGCSKGMP